MAVKKRRKKARKKVRVTPKMSLIIIAGCILVAGAAILFNNRDMRKADATASDSSLPGPEVPAGNFDFGIDISHHNKDDIKWDELKVMTDKKGRTTKSIKNAKEITPVSFVIMKATEGLTFQDSKFDKWWEETDESDLRRGAYHFFRTSKDPVGQAEHYIKIVGRLKKTDLPPILDLETIHRGCSKATLNKNAALWLETVRKYYDRKPVIYTSRSFVENILDDSLKDKYHIWISDYFHPEPTIRKWYIWQFTDNALVYGVPGKVDLNVMR